MRSHKLIYILGYLTKNMLKKKKNIITLSGKQIWLLFLFFIFSLLNCKTSQFYILDEIDVVLDFNHTKNLTKIIKKFFSVSQFIKVTSKKGLVFNSNTIFKVKVEKEYSIINRC